MSFLGPLRAEIRAASWFAALGEPLTDGDLADACAYAGVQDVEGVTSWPEAETFLKAPGTSLDLWNRDEELRKSLLAQATTHPPERAMWTALSDLTAETGDLVHGKAASAATRMGRAVPASVHVAAGAATQATYQYAVARLAGTTTSPFESKFRLFAGGRWPLGIEGSRLVLF